MDPMKRIFLEDAQARIKAIISDLEQNIGINESAPINLALLRALAKLDEFDQK